MVRYKGKDQLEFGYKDYSEASYGGSPGATPTTLYRVGHVSEMTPMYDPELSRVFVLRDSATPAPLALTRRRENVGLRISWLQGTLGTYWQTQILAGDNFFAETKIYRDGSNQLYVYWTGLKADVVGVRCGVGEPLTWSAELVGKTVDAKATTIHSYGASPGNPWEWSDAYVEISPNDSDWSTIPEVTDWEFRVDNRLNPTSSSTTPAPSGSPASRRLSALKWFRGLLRRALTTRKTVEMSAVRKVRIREEAPTDRFVLIIVLMIIFFAGLISLEVIHIVLLGTWNEVVFNGIMLVVGTIVGAVWGRQND